MLSIDSCRLLLRLEEEDIDDDQLKKYIDHFTLSTLERLGLSAKQDQTILDNPLFQDAVMAGIACNLSLTDLDMIHAPSSYKVGNTEESYKNTSFGNYGQIPSWCDRYNEMILALSKQYASMQDIQVFRRRGMSVRRKYHRDLY